MPLNHSVWCFQYIVEFSLIIFLWESLHLCSSVALAQGCGGMWVRVLLAAWPWWPGIGTDWLLGGWAFSAERLVWGLHNGVCQPHSPCSGEHAPFKLLPLHQESEHVRFWVIHYKWSLCFLKLSIKPHLPSNQAFLGLVFPVQENHAGDWGWGSPVWVSDPSLFGKNICSCDYCLFCGLPNLAFGSWLDCCSYLSYCVSFFISWVVESFFC